MSVPETFNLPYTRGPIRIEANGRFVLGDHTVAYPFERSPLYHEQQQEEGTWTSLTMSGKAMLAQVCNTTDRVEIHAGFGLMAALIIEGLIKLADFPDMATDTNPQTVTMSRIPDDFDLPYGSRIVFGDIYRGELTIHVINSTALTEPDGFDQVNRDALTTLGMLGDDDAPATTATPDAWQRPETPWA